MSYTIVVARFNENISWLQSEHDHCIIYNKGEPLNIPNERMLDNVGRESDTYLQYVIDHYHDLPDVVVFTQARISDHTGTDDVRQLIQMKNEAQIYSKSINFKAYTEDGVCRIHWGKSWNVRPEGYYLPDNYKNNTPIVFWEWFEKHIMPYPSIIRVYCNAIFAVKKEHILCRPIEYFCRLQQEVNHHVNPSEGHFLERSWYYIFDSDTSQAVLNK